MNDLIGWRWRVDDSLQFKCLVVEDFDAVVRIKAVEGKQLFVFSVQISYLLRFDDVLVYKHCHVRKFENFYGLFCFADNKIVVFQRDSTYVLGWQVELVLAAEIDKVVDPNCAGLACAEKQVFVGRMVLQSCDLFQIPSVLVD